MRLKWHADYTGIGLTVGVSIMVNRDGIFTREQLHELMGHAILCCRRGVPFRAAARLANFISALPLLGFGG